MSERRLASFILIGLITLSPIVAVGQGRTPALARAALPEVNGWRLAEAPRTYLPGTLFEYIDGAAENYLSYSFQELVVADYKSETTPATLTVEIYDMENDLNAFGIYSSERSPGSPLVAAGTQGYLEEGTLNFIIGPAYVKLLCFDGGTATDTVLKEFARGIEKRVEIKGSLPPVLRLFPRDGLVAESERFIRQNVLGYGFLHDGYLASYRSDGRDFEAFIIVGRDAGEAAKMQEQYLAGEAKNQAPVEKTSQGYHVKDRYARNVFLALRGRCLLGVMRLPDGSEAAGSRFLDALMKAVGD
jgi:hypothetical protein